MPEDQHAGRPVRWTNEAIVALASLSTAVRRSMLDRIEMVAQFPAMYPARQRGRFTDLRYFVVARKWIVYYHAEESAISIVTIVPALSRPK